MTDADRNALADRDKGLTEYLASMDRAGGGIYTADFREGFRHALVMLAAYESDDQSLDADLRRLRLLAHIARAKGQRVDVAEAAAGTIAAAASRLGEVDRG